jgi:putative ABC transport system permease protein
MREQWSFPFVESLWRDVRYGARVLWHAPAFTVVAIMTIALGVGANAAVFSVADAVLIRPLPFARADRLVRLYSVVAGNTLGPSPADARDLADESHVFESLAVYDFWLKNVSITPGDRPEQGRIGLVTAEYFAVLGIKPTIGRTFTTDETHIGKDKVVLLTTKYWREHFAGTLGVLGRTVRIDDEPYTVVGVMPDVIPDWIDGVSDGRVTLWTPLALPAENYGALHRGDRNNPTLARLRPGVSIATATADVQRVAANLATRYPVDRGVSARVVPLSETRTGALRPTLILLLASAAMILLIACTNVASLILARHTLRHQEMVVRASLGASRGSLIRQLVAEHLLLTLLGGAGGLAAAWLTTIALVHFRPPALPQLAEVHIDAPVLLYALAVTLSTGALIGLIPAWSTARTNLGSAIREGERSGTAGRRRQTQQHALVVAQIACCVILVLWTSLLVKSLLRLQHQENGFQATHLLTAHVNLPHATYPHNPDPGVITRFCERFAERVRAIVGVQDATITTTFPPLNRYTRTFTIEGQAASRLDDLPRARFGVVDVRYRGTLGVPLVAGRDFDESDVATNRPAVILINQVLARRYFADGDAIGRRLQLRQLDMSSPSDTGMTIATIVGVIASTKNRGLAFDPDPEIVGLFRQMPDMNYGSKSIVVRTISEPSGITERIREALRAVDPELALAEPMTIDAVIADQTTDRRLSTMLLGLFTASGVMLALIGVYGVVAYFVAQRTKEIGVRVALGARRADILLLVLGQGLRLAVIGIALGAAGAFAMRSVLSRFLFAVAATDPTILVGVPLLIASIAMAACYLPAYRATRLDPARALRE